MELAAPGSGGAAPSISGDGQLVAYGRARVFDAGLMRVPLGLPGSPGRGAALVLRAAKWFDAADADQDAAATLLTVRIGDRCFTHPATRKLD